MSKEKCYGNVKWGEPDEYPDPIPDAFVKAKSLYEEDAEKNYDQIISLISPFYTAVFVPEGVDGVEEVLSDKDDVYAKKVRIVGVEFKNRDIPSVKVEAEFELNFTKTLDELEKWEEENTYLRDGFSFIIEIDDQDYYEGLDNHSGMEFIVGMRF